MAAKPNPTSAAFLRRQLHVRTVLEAEKRAKAAEDQLDRLVAYTRLLEASIERMGRSIVQT